MRDLFLPNFLFVLPVSAARSFSAMLTIGRIAYRQEGGDGSVQHGRMCNLQLPCYGSVRFGPSAEHWELDANAHIE